MESETPVATKEAGSVEFEEAPETEEPTLEEAGFAVVGEETSVESQGSGLRAEGSGFAETEIEPETPALVEEETEPVAAELIEPVSEDVESQALQYELMSQEDSGEVNEELISREIEVSRLIENQFGEVLDTEIEPVFEADDLAAPSLEPLVADLMDEGLSDELETDSSSELKDAESQALQYELIQEDVVDPDDNLISREIEISAVLENQFGEVLDTEQESAFEADDLSSPSLEPLLDELIAETQSSQEPVLADFESEESIQLEGVEPEPGIQNPEPVFNELGVESEFSQEPIPSDSEPEESAQIEVVEAKPGTLEVEDSESGTLNPETVFNELVAERELSEEISLSVSDHEEFAQIEDVEAEPGILEAEDFEPQTLNPEPDFEVEPELQTLEIKDSEPELLKFDTDSSPELEVTLSVESEAVEPGTRNPEPGTLVSQFPRFSETLKLEPVKPVDAPIEEGLSAIESILQRGKTAKLKPIVPAEGVYSEYVHRLQNEQGDISEAVRAVTAPLTGAPQPSQWAEEVTLSSVPRTSEPGIAPPFLSAEMRSVTPSSAAYTWKEAGAQNIVPQDVPPPVFLPTQSHPLPGSQPVWSVSFDESESGSLNPADIKEELAGKVAELMTAQELNKTLVAHWTNRFTQFEVSFIKLVIDPFVKQSIPITSQLSQVILSPVAEMIETECRTEPKLIAYCGSAEFFIVLPGVASDEVAEIAEHLRSQAESLWLSMPGQESNEWLSVSLGVVTSFPFKSSLDSLLHAVDLALELAKDAGGNRVMISPSPLD